MYKTNVLITGGMGFIGKFLTSKILSKRDYHITIVDNLSSSLVDEEIYKSNRVTSIKADFKK